MFSSNAPTTQISNIDFTDSEVQEVLAGLDPTKAAGCDKISPFVLKHCACIFITSSPSVL